MNSNLSRRAVLAGVAGGLAMTTATTPARAETPQPKSFSYCLNTSTVRDKDGKSRSITDLIDIASKAGYAAFEPWISEIDAYLKTGGTLKELRKRITDAGLAVPDVIGFSEWIVEDAGRRKKGLEQAKRSDMEWASEIGSAHIAAPPVGATGGTE